MQVNLAHGVQLWFKLMLKVYHHFESVLYELPHGGSIYISCRDIKYLFYFHAHTQSLTMNKNVKEKFIIIKQVDKK